MAPAAELLSDLGVEVLASPKLGVQAAVAYLQGRALAREPAVFGEQPFFGA
jgi:hypothetical protein